MSRAFVSQNSVTRLGMMAEATFLPTSCLTDQGSFIAGDDF